MSYSDALSIHFFNKPYDRSVVPSAELHERDKKLLHIMGNPQSSWTSGYNYMRSQLFTGTQMDNLGKVHSWMEKPIFVTSYSTPWGNNGKDPDPENKSYHGYYPVRLPDTSGVQRELAFRCGNYGIDGLFHNTSCAGAWYFLDTTVGFKNRVWASEGGLYGLGITYSKDVVHTSNPAGGSWNREYQPGGRMSTGNLWEQFKIWVETTDSLK